MRRTRWTADGGQPLARAIVLLAALASVARAETDVVRVLSRYGQTVTSSILRWVSVEPGQPLPENAVIGAVGRPGAGPTAAPEDETVVPEDRAFVCRLRQEGMWVSGQVRPAEDARCAVSMHGLLYRSDNYELLENAENGARLSWARWDKYVQMPAGAVTGDGTNYVARRQSPEDAPSERYTHQLGRLDPDGLGKLTVISGDSTAAEHEDGEVLVETEPVSYAMTAIKFNLWRKRLQQSVVELGAKQLANWDIEGGPSRVDAVISYRYNYSMSWGHGQALITGLPVSVRMLNGTALNEFKWGIDTASERQELYSVEAVLAPGTAVNVTLVGNYTEATVPWAGQVTAVYEDGEKRERPAAGSRRELAMRDVRPVFSEPYFLANGSRVPTTTTTSTTSTSTSTTSTSSTTARTSTTEPPAPLPVPPSPIERPAVGKKAPATTRDPKGENSAMQNDEGAGSSTRPSSGGGGAGPRLAIALLLVAAVGRRALVT